MFRQAERPSSNRLSPVVEKAVDWRPALAKQKGATKHAALTERIIADIDAGVLKPMDRMPTHRDLARELGISVQTVSLSYKEAERLGYLSGEVGRGTFVKSRVTEQAGRLMLDRSPTEAVDLSIVRGVYRLIKQIFTTIFSKSGTSFKRVGLIEFPRRGLYALVFLAGDPPQEVEDKLGNGNPMITVFMPNGPNPTTGFIVFMPASEVIALDMAVEDAAKLVVSAGLVGPDQERLRELARSRGLKPVPDEEPVV